ncbi:cytosine/adenosine deaminase-related metal-dependent hydrolase [Streptomyces sp. SAI-144]|nr:hypothetical protein [Streptomyces sp. SAI-144]MDH6433041.1 cytosine/adenosine deaminase-related metal-dependent hydrolase [Streptomyces sp. SAI-144]
MLHGDLIVLDLDAPHLRPLHDPWSTRRTPRTRRTSVTPSWTGGC